MFKNKKEKRNSRLPINTTSQLWFTIVLLKLHKKASEWQHKTQPPEKTGTRFLDVMSLFFYFCLFMDIISSYLSSLVLGQDDTIKPILCYISRDDLEGVKKAINADSTIVNKPTMISTGVKSYPIFDALTSLGEHVEKNDGKEDAARQMIRYLLGLPNIDLSLVSLPFEYSVLQAAILTKDVEIMNRVLDVGLTKGLDVFRKNKMGTL